MTPQDHNKVIGIMHLIWGGFHALILLFLVPFLLLMGTAISSDPSAPTEVKAIFGVFGVFFLLLAVVLGLPPLLAGYAMLRRRSWARVAGIVASCFMLLNVPFGMALSIYTLWFMFGPGERFYAGGGEAGGRMRGSLGEAGTSTFGWDAQRASETYRQKEYVPPPQPPDWRS